jgi:hypothetical protein
MSPALRKNTSEQRKRGRSQIPSIICPTTAEHTPSPTNGTHRGPHPHEGKDVGPHGNRPGRPAPDGAGRRLAHDLAKRQLLLFFFFGWCCHDGSSRRCWSRRIGRRAHDELVQGKVRSSKVRTRGQRVSFDCTTSVEPMDACPDISRPCRPLGLGPAAGSGGTRDTHDAKRARAEESCVDARGESGFSHRRHSNVAWTARTASNVLDVSSRRTSLQKP